MQGDESLVSVMTELNLNNQLLLQDILCVYGHIAIDNKISHIRLTTLDDLHMTLQFKHADIPSLVEKIIQVDNDQDDSEADMKSRLLRMGEHAAMKRGLSTVQVNEMAYPGSILEYLIIFGVCLPTLCYKFRKLLYFGFQWIPLPQDLSNLLLKFLDNDSVLLSIIVLELIIHLGETLLLLRPRLEYYRVPNDFLIEWYFFGLLEGYAPVRRLGKLAKRKLNS